MCIRDRFYYEFMKRKYGDKCSLLFTDTDSLCMAIKTDDLYADIEKDLQFFDTRNFERDHPLFSNKHHRVLGKFKSETGSRAPAEFVGLRAKMYSLHVPSALCHVKVKGIKNILLRKTFATTTF